MLAILNGFHTDKSQIPYKQVYWELAIYKIRFLSSIQVLAAYISISKPYTQTNQS